jgi:catechol 2,3-dioxygenase-like lactoylglutathione lyase family enzyme
VLTKRRPLVSTSRIQLALNVSDLDAATRFYTDLFGVEPAKQRSGYTNFVVTDPPLKLVLFENPAAASPLNHLGVELASSDDVRAAAQRLEKAGMPHSFAESDRCCHAVQDKVWVDAPDVPLGGWELYTVLADDPAQDTEPSEGACCDGGVIGSACCGGGSCGS